MTPLGDTLAGMGLGAYTARFRDEGFDTWDTLMDITETDLDALDVKLGHRRKLQRAIAEAQSINVAHPQQKQRSRDSSNAEGADGYRLNDTEADNAKPQKRKYTRRPPKDPNAPKRPLPAYVVYANELRAITPRNVEFKEFTKLVGKNWQAQDPVEKEQREAAAQKLKDEYNKRNSEYKKTANYAKYQEILAAWKLKHPNGQAATHDAKRQCVGLGNVDSIRDNSIERDDDYSLNSNEDENHSPSSPPMAPNTYDSSMTSTMATRWRAGGLQPAGGFASPPPRSSFGGYDRPDDHVPHRSSGHHEDRNLVTSGHLAYGSLSDSDRSYSRRLNTQGSLNVGGFRALAPEPAVPSLGGETTLPPRSVRRPDDRSSADRAFSGPQSVPRYERHSSPKSVPDRLLPAPAELLRSVSVEERSRWSDRSRERYPSPHQPAHPSDPSRGVYYSSPRSTRRSPPHLNDAPQAQRHFEAGGRQSPAPQERAPLSSRTRNDQPPGSPPAPTASPSKSDRLRPILDGQSWVSREDTAEPDRRAKNPDLMTLLRPSENDREAARPSLQPQMALGRTT